MQKTNAIRIIQSKKIKFNVLEYDSNITDGQLVASQLGQDANRVFKTLVTISNSNQNYVFVVPVNANLDLKKVAKVVGAKSIEMIKQKDLLPLTGYIHGGCSPIGMKKFFPTFIHKTANDYESIFFSAGKVGVQVEVCPRDIPKLIRCDMNNDLIV